MQFEELDARMRQYETVNDRLIPKGTYMVARIDGRGFTRLTKEKHPFEAPFDERFRDYMIGTVAHLMQCGFRILYGYTQSDEISLLFDPEETAFARKERKYNSILAGEASARFSVLLGDIGSFDCRISELPDKDRVADYFRWRHEDAYRNALSAHCYWKLRKDGYTAGEATSRIEGTSTEDKLRLLSEYGIDFSKLPAWQKRGTGLYFRNIDKEGLNPLTGEKVFTKRRELYTESELPEREFYNRFILEMLSEREQQVLKSV